jgi:hypothetical protein
MLRPTFPIRARACARAPGQRRRRSAGVEQWAVHVAACTPRQPRLSKIDGHSDSTAERSSSTAACRWPLHTPAPTTAFCAPPGASAASAAGLTARERRRRGPRSARQRAPAGRGREGGLGLAARAPTVFLGSYVAAMRQGLLLGAYRGGRHASQPGARRPCAPPITVDHSARAHRARRRVCAPNTALGRRASHCSVNKSARVRLGSICGPRMPARARAAAPRAARPAGCDAWPRFSHCPWSALSLPAPTGRRFEEACGACWSGCAGRAAPLVPRHFNMHRARTPLSAAQLALARSASWPPGPPP